MADRVQIGEAVSAAIRAFTDGLCTFDELRTTVLEKLSPAEVADLFAVLPPDASAKLVSWVQHVGQQKERSLLVGTFLPSEERPSPDTTVQDAIFSHVDEASTWLGTLNLSQAVSNVLTDSFGDWYRDPWGWPELSFLSDGGRVHVLTRAMKGPTGAATALDVPKTPTKARPAVILDLIDRVLYQACVDSVAPMISRQLPRRVYGWRLPARSERGHQYARNDYQWDSYVSDLHRGARTYQRAWKTDISNFFATVTPTSVANALAPLAPRETVRAILDIVKASAIPTGRSGIPQRSTASSVIANLLLVPVDNAIESIAGKAREARWLDDIWLFSRSDADLAEAAGRVESRITELGFVPNQEKTGFYEGAELQKAIDRLNLSYVDAQLARNANDDAGLDQALHGLLSAPELSGRHEVNFVTSRIKQYNKIEMAKALAQKPEALAHAADLVASVLLKFSLWRDLTHWCEDLLTSPLLPWVKTSFLRSFPRTGKLPKDLVEVFAKMASDDSTPSILRVTAISRISRRDRNLTRDIFSASLQNDLDPLTRRGMALAAANAGASSKTIRRFLLADDATTPIADYLSSIAYDETALPLKA
jgi:hypothetical protein